MRAGLAAPVVSGPSACWWCKRASGKVRTALWQPGSRAWSIVRAWRDWYQMRLAR